MEFTSQPLLPFGQTLLDMFVESDLGLKTAMVFRVIKLLQDHGYLPSYGCHLAQVCLEEALTNAIVHGNKLDRAKKVHVIVCGDEERFGILIEDEGEGFGSQQVPDQHFHDDILRERGRGILLMSHYLDKVQFGAKGNRLRMIRKKQLKPDPGVRPPVVLPEAKAIPTNLNLSDLDLSIPEIQHVSQAAVAIPEEIKLEFGGADTPAPGTAVEPVAEADPNAPVTVHERAGAVIARLRSPRLTEDNAEEVRTALYQAAGRGKNLVVDLAEVEFMSSVGISTIIGTHKMMAQKKNKMILASVGPALSNVLKATGLLKFFPIEKDQDAAIRKINSK